MTKTDKKKDCTKWAMSGVEGYNRDRILFREVKITEKMINYESEALNGFLRSIKYIVDDLLIIDEKLLNFYDYKQVRKQVKKHMIKHRILLIVSLRSLKHKYHTKNLKKLFRNKKFKLDTFEIKVTKKTNYLPRIVLENRIPFLKLTLTNYLKQKQVKLILKSNIKIIVFDFNIRRKINKIKQMFVGIDTKGLRKKREIIIFGWTLSFIENLIFAKKSFFKQITEIIFNSYNGEIDYRDLKNKKNLPTICCQTNVKLSIEERRVKGAVHPNVVQDPRNKFINHCLRSCLQ